MTLIKTSILSAIATIVKILAGFVSVKIVAIYIGPSGLALMGQMQNFIGMLSSVASGGINNGVIKYTAEHYDDEAVKQKIWNSALQISFVFLVPIGIVVVIFSDFISLKLLGTTKYSSIFVIFSTTVIFFVMNGLLTSILNGQKEIKILTLINIIGSLIGLVITVVLVTKYKIYGALLSGMITQSVVFFVTLVFVIKRSWFKISLFTKKFDKKYIKKLLSFSAMTLVSATMIPLSHIAIRNYIGNYIGWDEAGYWQAIWRISETYLMLITTTLSVYYLPKLSSIDDTKELRHEIFQGYKIILPITILMATIIYLLRDTIVMLLFTEEFSPMVELFLYQLLGDIVKIASWLFGFIMVAKAMTKLYILSEVFFIWSFVIIAIVLMNLYGLIGVTIAFLINYIMYAIFLYFALRGYLNDR